MLSGKRDRFKGIWEARKCSFKGQVRANTKYSATKLHPQPSRGFLFKRQMWNKPWTWDRINDEIPWSQKATWKVLEANPGGLQPWWNPQTICTDLWDTLCAGAQGWLKCSCWKSSSPAARRQHQAWSLVMQASEDSRGFVMCGSRSQASVVCGTLAQIWYHGCAQGLDEILLAA